MPKNDHDTSDNQRRLPRWFRPPGFAAAGVGAAAAMLLRGCWHTHLGWPIRYDAEYSYRVCTECGAVRLFDEKTFREYGPYDHDLRSFPSRPRC